MHFLLRYILRKPILLAILLLQAASLLHGTTSYEKLADYLETTFSQEKISQLHNDGILSDEMVSQLADLKTHVLDVSKAAYQKFVANHTTPVPGVNDSIELTQTKFTSIKKNIDSLQKFSLSQAAPPKEPHAKASLQDIAQHSIENLKNYGNEHGLSSEDFKKSEKGSDPIVSANKAFDHRTKINELKEAARQALRALSLNQIALDKDQWAAIASYGLLNKKYPTKSFTPQKNTDAQQEEALVNAFFSNIEGIYDHINELSVALDIAQSRPVLGVGLAVWLRIPKSGTTAELIEKIKKYNSLDEETEQYIQICQEFDIITNADIVECKRINGKVDCYIPNVKRQQLVASRVYDYLFKWNFVNELSRERVTELVQGKTVYCHITYKQPQFHVQENSANEFEKILSRASSRAESRAASETKMLSHGIGVDNGDAYICPLNILDCSQEISSTSAKSAISALVQAKKEVLTHSCRPLVLHIIMKDEQAPLLKKMLEFSGFIAPKTRERRNSAPETSRATPTLHHQEGTPTTTSSSQQRTDTPTTPLGILLSPELVVNIRTATPDRQTPTSPIAFDNTPPVTAHKPTPERTPPRKKVSSLHDTTQPKVENQPGSSCAKKLPL